MQLIEFATRHWDLFLALIIILAFLVNNMFGARLRGYGELIPVEAVQKINHENALVLDVREANEIAQGHILDAIHIPVGSFAGRIGEIDEHKDRAVIVSCRSGHRSARACVMLRKAGFEKVFNLKGGVLSWQNSNLPLELPVTNTKKKKKG